MCTQIMPGNPYSQLYSSVTKKPQGGCRLQLYVKLLQGWQHCKWAPHSSRVSLTKPTLEHAYAKRRPCHAGTA